MYIQTHIHIYVHPPPQHNQLPPTHTCTLSNSRGAAMRKAPPRRSGLCIHNAALNSSCNHIQNWLDNTIWRIQTVALVIYTLMPIRRHHNVNILATNVQIWIAWDIAVSNSGCLTDTTCSEYHTSICSTSCTRLLVVADDPWTTTFMHTSIHTWALKNVWLREAITMRVGSVWRCWLQGRESVDHDTGSCS